MSFASSFLFLLAQVPDAPPDSAPAAEAAPAATAASTAAATWAEANPWATASIVFMLIAIIVLGSMLGFILFRRRAESASSRWNDDDFRHIVAMLVLFSAIWGTVVVAGVAIVIPKNAYHVLTLLLPMFGTWVGTLLAFYFGKENYESGARNSATLAKELTGIEKLRGIPVTQPGIMILLDKIEVPAVVRGKRVADFPGVLLKELRSQMRQQRLPLIDPDTGAAFAVIHKSLLDDFLVKQGMLAAANLDNANLQQLLDDPNSGKIAKSSFVVIPNTATLADVKERMAQQSAQTGVSCEDAFIVPPGTGKVQGWITNDIINANALPFTSDGKTG